MAVRAPNMRIRTASTRSLSRSLASSAVYAPLVTRNPPSSYGLWRDLETRTSPKPAAALCAMARQAFGVGGRAIIFAENLVDRMLLPFPHLHITFSTLKRIRPFFYFDHDLYSILYKAAWQTWNELVGQALAARASAKATLSGSTQPGAQATTNATSKTPDARCGTVLALHSAGELLNKHPHVHGIFLSGAISQNGSFTPVHVYQSALSALFDQKVLRELVEVGRLSKVHIDNMLGWEHSGFNVHISDFITPDDKNRLLQLAGYLTKCPLSLVPP
jgi:hypothetical protein